MRLRLQAWRHRVELSPVSSGQYVCSMRRLLSPLGPHGTPGRLWLQRLTQGGVGAGEGGSLSALDVVGNCVARHSQNDQNERCVFSVLIFMLSLRSREKNLPHVPIKIP